MLSRCALKGVLQGSQPHKQKNDAAKPASPAPIEMLQAAEERRLNFGVELYGYQQQLAQVLAGVEQSRSQVLELATRRQKEEPISAKMRHDVEKNAESLEADRADVSLFMAPARCALCPTHCGVTPSALSRLGFEQPPGIKMQHLLSRSQRTGVCRKKSQRIAAMQVEAFQKELNDVSNELRLLQQHTEDQQGSVLVQKG